jgi:molecular chaperone DnaK
MSFILGLDVGTASGAGATKRDGRVQPCALGNRTATLPSVVVLHEDGTTLVGDEAERVAGLELPRIARDVRLDPVQHVAPIMVGGQVHTPHELLRSLYSTIVERVCFSHNATPSHIVLTHPPVPDGRRCETVEQIADELFPGALVVPEPIAAAVKLACDGSLPVDCIVAVYDLGGGTFDVTMVRRDGDRFSVVGEPSGLPQFGGIDVDDLVLDHVDRSLDGAVTGLELSAPGAMAALTHLRAECRHAKERLSYETEVDIDASLPDAPALVRLTRAEFDDLLLPKLVATVDVLERTIADAGLEARDVDALALVGGSSRIPLVADVMAARTSIPVLVDPYPELTVALGAAQMVDDDAPSSSVFPFAELALPSLTALSGTGGSGGSGGSGGAGGTGGRTGMLTPSGGQAAAGTIPGDGVGRTGQPTNGHPVGLHGGDALDDTEFETLMQRGRDMDGSGSRRLEDTEGGAGPGSALSRAASQGLNPKVGVAILLGLVVVLLVGVLLLGGGGSDPEQAETAGSSDTTDGDDSTTSSSSTSSSTTSSETTTTTDGGVIPPPDPTTTDDPDPPPTTEEPPTTTTPPTTSRPTTTSTTTSTSTTTTTTSTTTTTTTLAPSSEASPFRQP